MSIEKKTIAEQKFLRGIDTIIRKCLTTSTNNKTISFHRNNLLKGKRIPRNTGEVKKWNKVSGIPKSAWLDIEKYHKSLKMT